jgi:hypothetical protein
MRPLKRAAMVGGEGLAVSGDRVEDAALDAKRIDALTKLDALFVTGVLTEEQYRSERGRLTEGI